MIRKLCVLLCIMFIIIFTSCGSAVSQNVFPLKLEDIEKAVKEQGLNWKLDKTLNGENPLDSRYVFLNEENVEFTVYTTINESENGIVFGWYLPKDITKDKIDKFYHEEIPEVFDLISTLYGKNKELRNGLGEFSEYYKSAEGNFEDGIYWAKRIGDNHISINANLENVKTGILNINSNIVFEEVILRSRIEKYKNHLLTDNLKISSSTVDKMKKSYVSGDGDFSGEYFVIQGHLENIKEINNIPERLANINFASLKPNKDTYLSANLVDDTGSIDVFVETTSLSTDDLKTEREHIILMLNYENEPFYVVRCSTLSK